jgi:dethiobiotin synthetase
VDEQLLLDGLRAWRGLVEWLFVEGAGGLLSPLSDHFTLADLMVEARGPAIVVIANRLGCVNHARLTVEALERRRIPIAALVLNEANPGDDSDRSRQSNVELLRETLPEQVMWKCGWNSELQQPEGDVWSTITWQSAVDQLSKRA